MFRIEGMLLFRIEGVLWYLQDRRNAVAQYRRNAVVQDLLWFEIEGVLGTNSWHTAIIYLIFSLQQLKV